MKNSLETAHSVANQRQSAVDALSSPFLILQRRRSFSFRRVSKEYHPQHQKLGS